MEAIHTITVSSEKSNKSDNNVWVIATYRRKKQYCRNARTALRYAFLLKKKTGRRIADESFDLLVSQIQLSKAQA